MVTKRETMCSETSWPHPGSWDQLQGIEGGAEKQHSPGSNYGALAIWSASTSQGSASRGPRK